MDEDAKTYKVKMKGAEDAAQKADEAAAAADEAAAVETAEKAAPAKIAAEEASTWWAVLGCAWLMAAFFIPKLPVAATIAIVAAELALILFWRKRRPGRYRCLARGMVVGAIATFAIIITFSILLAALQGALATELNNSAAEMDTMMEMLSQRSEG